ncbi:MAG: S8 family serine peptidase, partial [Oscillospiraceae bacterium]
MKCFWKRLLSFGLMMGLLLTGIPSAGALTSDEVAPVGQTASTDWKKLLTHSKPTLPQEGTYAPNRLLVTRVDNGMRAMPLRHECITGIDTLFSLDVPRQAQELMQMNMAGPEKITCTAVSLLEGSDMLSVMSDLSQEPGVLAVEVDRLHTLDSVVEGGAEAVPQVLAPAQDPFAPAQDPFVAQQTWLEFMGATKAWDMVTAQGKVPGEGVVVAVLDTGITTQHPDLKGQFVDGGLQFLLNTETKKVVINSSIEDGNGHGTHVSGMIAGAKNGTGITGVAYGAKILPIKVLSDEGGGYDSAIAVGMLYAAGKVDKDGHETPLGTRRCDIANMSLGGNAGIPSTAY